MYEKSKKSVAILTYEKFQDHEMIYPYHAFKQYGFNVCVFANKYGRIFGSLGAHIESDFDYDTYDLKVDDFSLLYIPGGVKALEKLRLEKKAVQFVKDWFSQDKPTFCICNGAQLLITADVLRGRKCSGYYSIEPDIRNAGAEYSDDFVCIDGNLVTSPHYNYMGEWIDKGFKHFYEEGYL